MRKCKCNVNMHHAHLSFEKVQHASIIFLHGHVTRHKYAWNNVQLAGHYTTKTK